MLLQMNYIIRQMILLKLYLIEWMVKEWTDQIKLKIREQINSISIQNALKKVIEEESKNGSLIITTAEELKIYHTIKTILIHKKEIDEDRITYRDQKK